MCDGVVGMTSLPVRRCLSPCSLVPAQLVAWTATYLAAKLEEHQAKGWNLFSLLRVFHRIDSRQMGRPLDLLQPHSQVRFLVLAEASLRSWSLQ